MISCVLYRPLTLYAIYLFTELESHNLSFFSFLQNMSLDPYFYILTLCRGDIFCLLPMKTSIIISLWYLNILRSSQSLFVEDLLKIVNNIEHHSISEKKKIRRSFVRVYDSLIWLVSLSHCVIKYLWKLESVKNFYA